MLSYRFRAAKYKRIRDMPATAPAEIEVGMDSVPVPKGRRLSQGQSEEVWHGTHPPGSGESGMGVTREHEGPMRRRARRGSRSSRIGVMLEGYYEIIRRAIAVTVVMRGIGAVIGLLWLWRKYRRRN